MPNLIKLNENTILFEITYGIPNNNSPQKKLLICVVPHGSPKNDADFRSITNSNRIDRHSSSGNLVEWKLNF